jgi:hypothetical protein
MSFGNINNILEKTIKILDNNINDNLTLQQISELKQKVIIELDEDVDIIDEIFSRLFKNSYIYKKEINFDYGKECFREFENQYPDIHVPEKYIELEKHFNKLKELPQPEQRTKEWFDYRYNRITASDTAAAIDLNPYEPVEGFILKKCDPNYPFRDNATVFHGKKYEPTDRKSVV